jgi:cobalt-zinc-cadmium efflux system outer membrane protein
VKFTGDGARHDSRPAITVPLPVFNQGQPDLMAARAQASQAAFTYAARREQVTQEVRDAAASLEQSSASLRAWREDIVPALEQTVQRSERAYSAGDISYLVVLDNLQRLIDAQRAEIDASANASRAAAALARHVGGAIPQNQ